jgi:hypothetical protein
MYRRKRTAELKEDWLLPFYYHSRTGEAGEPEHEQLLYFPFFYRSRFDHGDGETISVFPPFYVRTEVKSSGVVERWFPWPLVRTRRGPGEKSFRILFLASHSRGAAGAREWSASVLGRYRRAPEGAEVGGLGSRDGYLGLQMVRRARGTNSSTWAVNPLLFGYHRDDTLGVLKWNSLLYLQRYERLGEETRFSALGLVWGRSNPDRSWWSVFPLVHSLEERTGPLPGFVLPSIFHLYGRAKDQNETRWSVLGVLANGSRAREGPDYDFRIFHAWTRFSRHGSFFEKKIEPFFIWEKNEETGEYYRSILKFIYISKRASRDAPIRRYLFGIPIGS